MTDLKSIRPERLEALASGHFAASANEQRLLVQLAREALLWRQNVETLLTDGDRDNLRAREGGGDEDLIMSLVLTLTKARAGRAGREERFAVLPNTRTDGIAGMVNVFNREQDAQAWADHVRGNVVPCVDRDADPNAAKKSRATKR